MMLVCDGVEVAPVEVADSRVRRLRGLLGRRSFQGAMHFPRTRSVHTLGMQFPLDVAFCDASMRVTDVVTMVPWRVGRVRADAQSVVEAAAGSFVTWGLRVGSSLELRS